MKNATLVIIFLFIISIAASAYYFASGEADLTGNVISLKQAFTKRVTDSSARAPIPAERPIYSVSRAGVFASTLVEGTTFSLNDLSVQIFKKPNMDYRAVVKWKVNAPPSRAVAASYITFYANKTRRLTGDTLLIQVAINYTLGPINDVELTYDFLEEGTEHLISIETNLEWGGELKYNLTFRTPPIAPAAVECKKIVDNGPVADKFNIFFVPVGYSNEEISSGTYGNDVRDILFNADPASPEVNKRRSLLGIPIFNKSRTAFNVFIINSTLAEPVAYNKLVSIGKACSFNKERDIFIMLINEERGMAYAQGIGAGIWVQLYRSADTFQGSGAVLAHEIAHLIGFDEEYYGWADWGDPRPELAQAPNCDYGNLTCEKFCSGTNAELADEIHSAKHKAMQCADIIRRRDADAWQTFCPTLDLDEWFAASVDRGTSFCGATTPAEFCSLPLSTCFYACYVSTLMPLENENIGTGCREGYGCYLGCGTHYEYTKGNYVSIMGGGSLGEDNRILQDLDEASPTPIMPDFSKADSDILERYFSQFKPRITIRKPLIERIPSRRIPLP